MGVGIKAYLLSNPRIIIRTIRHGVHGVTTANVDLQNYRQQAKLLDGTYVTIRPISPEDKSPLVLFHGRLSDETKFMRFLCAKGELTDSDLKDFCDIDYEDNVALVAEREDNGKKRIVGVGRFYRLPTSKHTAEVAFVVEDGEQRKGIGTQLLKHLAILAWERDIYFFVGEMFRENSRMLSIFRKADPELYHVHDDDHTSTVKLSVAEIIDRTE